MYLYRFIPKCKCCGVVSHIKRYSTTIKNHEVISDLLGLSPRDALYFVTKEKLKQKDTQQLVQSIRYCQSLGFSNDDLLTNPTLLRQHFVALEHHYLSMMEGGFTNIDAAVLGRAVHYMKREIITLKRLSLIPFETDVAESFVNHIDNKEIATKIYESYPDDTPWNIVHMNMLKLFLKWRLRATDDDLVTLFRVHKMIKYKSFKILQENIAIAEELGYDNEKILKNGYVLNNYPKYARTILEDFSNIAGLDMKNAVKVHPKLLMISPNNIIRIYGILKVYFSGIRVHDEAIRKYPQIFTMSPETIKTRLQIIDGNNNVKFLLKHPQLLKLILYHKRTKKRLSFIQELQLKCASITVLGTTRDAAFEKYIREGKDINHPTDVVFFVNNLFKTQDPSLKNRLMKHPYYLQVPLYKMAETYNFLVHRKFHPTNIYKVVHIILYPRNKIKNIIDSMTKEDIHDVDYKSLSQTEKLNILIYLMEKEHHFTGNGVWSNETTDTEAPLEIPEETYLPDSAEQPKM